MQKSIFFAEEVFEDDGVEALQHLHLSLNECQTILEIYCAEIDRIGQEMRYSK